MYWCKSRYALLATAVVLLLAVSACKQDSNAGTDTGKFFDIKGYFAADSARLSKQNPLISKTLVHNKSSDTKKTHISNWGNEFRLFSESDINKPAWKASYNVQESDDFLIYKAKDPGLKTRDVIIKRDGKKIKWILIFNHTKNMLYETVEKLSYFPDSLYLIQKTQRVKLLGTDTYKISGAFN